jgi:hypothetical protein
VNNLEPLIRGLAPELPAENACDCCEGIEVATPVVPLNRPALPSVTYRPGVFADFLASQEARLSSASLPALAGLQARDASDFSIALIDAWSCVCDVLSFYDERLANEAWLGTARERQSIVELGRLIGYRPRPGVAAATDLVFTLDDPPGAAPSVPAVTIPVGTRVQSVPGPDEKAQVFETVEAIDARVEWNAIVPRQSRQTLPANGQTGTWLKGVATKLKVGDAVLIVGTERGQTWTGDERWDFRFLTAVEPDSDADRTWIQFTHELGSLHPPSSASQQDAELFALRTRASLFGANAPHPWVFSSRVWNNYNSKGKIASGGDWNFVIANSTIYLDSIQSALVKDSWVVLTEPAPYIEAYKIAEATDDGCADYTVSARVTRLTLDSSENLDLFQAAYRKTSVYGASELLPFADWPIPDPVMGDSIELATLIDDPGKGRRLIVRGRRASVKVLVDNLALVPDDGSASRQLVKGDAYIMMAPPVETPPGSAAFIWSLRTPDGVTGTLTAPHSAFGFVSSGKDVDVISERAQLLLVEEADERHSRLLLASALKNAFDRASTFVHANVASGTHGETTQEILGDGKASVPFQSFQLKQAPLSYVSAATESGGSSTLQIRVDDLTWSEVPSLYGSGAGARVFESRLNEDGAGIATFGDGRMGARLPTGRNNVVARYRKGIGIAGSVRAATLTNLLDRPLGVKEVTNPIAASGGQDPETLDTARENAPVTVLTLGRVVSFKNYEDFARGFSGISKARADLLWDGESQRIAVTVAGPGGALVDESSGDLFQNLVAAFAAFGDPFLRATLVSYRPATFRIQARVRTDPQYTRATVLAAIEKRLRADWSFAARGFARVVASSAVLASMHSVPGVVAVDLDAVYRTAGPQTDLIVHDRLLAAGVELGAGGSMLGAEILTLDPAPLEFGSMA